MSYAVLEAVASKATLAASVRACLLLFVGPQCSVGSQREPSADRGEEVDIYPASVMESCSSSAAA